jgi:hypothetical protein
MKATPYSHGLVSEPCFYSIPPGISTGNFHPTAVNLLAAFRACLKIPAAMASSLSPDTTSLRARFKIGFVAASLLAARWAEDAFARPRAGARLQNLPKIEFPNTH